MATETLAPRPEPAKLNSVVELYTPPSRSAPPKDIEPTIIILCQWMGANPRPVSKYTTHYRSLYPNSRILSIRSLPSFFFTTPTSSRLDLFSPAISAIDADPSPTKRILVHIFSNGGALTLCDICHVYKSKNGHILPIHAIVLDSAPGTSTLRGGWAAMSILLPKTALLWYASASVIWLLLLTSWIMKRVLRTPSILERTRMRLNDAEIVDARAKRLYVYGEGDRLVKCSDVEKHAEEAETKALSVRRLKVQGSAHVSHMVVDPEAYWAAVKELWDSSVRS